MAAQKRKPPAPAAVSERTAPQPDYALPARLRRPGIFELALAAFLLLTLAFYYREFIFDRGAMLAGHDMITQALQTRKIAVEAVKAGEGLPLWNPYSYCGIPYIGFLPGPLYFPTSLLWYVMPIERAVGWAFIFMMFAGGMFTFLWIRELGLSRPAAGICAVAYAYTGWVASTLVGGHDGRMFVILLTPLVFWAAERGLRRRRLAYFMLMGLGVALQILSPQVQMMYFSSLALTAYFLFRLTLLWREERKLRPLLFPAAGFVAGFVMAVSISAVQFAPLMVNQQEYSHRGAAQGLGYEGWQHAVSFSMYPLETLGLVVPGFTGEPELYWGPESFKGHSEYLGLIPLFFAVVALVARRNRHTWFFAGLGLLALLFSWGGWTPFFKLPYYLLPMVKSFRGPNMMFFVTSFSLVTLAGYGLDYLLGDGVRKPEERARAFRVLVVCLGTVGLLFLVLAAGQSVLPQVLSGMLPEGVGPARMPALRQHYPAIIRAAFVSLAVGAVLVLLCWLWLRRIFSLWLLTMLLAVLAWADLMRMDRHWLETVEIDRFYDRDQVVDYLVAQREQDHQYRVFFYPTPQSRDYWDNSLLYFGIPTINASMPLRLKWYEELMGTHLFQNFARYPRLWHLLGAEYVMLRQGPFAAQFEQALPFLEKVVEDSRSGRNLYRNPQAWERYRLFSRFEVIAEDKQVVPRLVAEDFDPQTTLVLSEEPRFDSSRLDPSRPPRGTVRLAEYGTDHLVLEVESADAALLYLAETYHPFWQATVDGAPAEILRADLALRAVYLEPGTHRVEMRYVSSPYKWGLRLSIAASLVLAAVLGWTSRRKEW